MSKASDLDCSICLEPYCDVTRKPMMLTCCGNTTCMCVRKKNARCPLCRKPIIAANLIVNRALCDIIEQAKQQKEQEKNDSKLAAAEACDVCLREHRMRSSSACYCFDCTKWLCEFHQRTHQQSTNHQTIHSVNEIQSKPELKQRVAPRIAVKTCLSHANQLLLDWCVSCSRLVCQSCIACSHADHPVQSLDDAWNTLLNKINALQTSLQTAISQSSVFQDRLSQITVFEQCSVDKIKEFERHFVQQARTHAQQMIDEVKHRATMIKLPIEQSQSKLVELKLGQTESRIAQLKEKCYLVELSKLNQQYAKQKMPEIPALPSILQGCQFLSTESAQKEATPALNTVFASLYQQLDRSFPSSMVNSHGSLVFHTGYAHPSSSALQGYTNFLRRQTDKPMRDQSLVKGSVDLAQ